MPAIRVTCSCGEMKEVPPILAGSKARCKACGLVFRVPDAEGDGVPEEAPVVASGRSFSRLWLVRGIVLMALFHMIALASARAGSMIAGALSVPGPYWAGAIAVFGYFLGGYVLGKWSPGRAVAEPAVAVLIVLAGVYGLQLFRGDVALAATWVGKAGLAALALLAAEIGARVGERRQAEA